MIFLPPEPLYMYPIGYPFQISNHPFFASREYRQLIGGWLLGAFLASVISFIAPIFAMFALFGIVYSFAKLTLRIIPAKIEAWDCVRALASYPLNH